MHKKRQKPIRTKMIYSSQLDRLKKDSLELKEYIRSVEKEGNQMLARKLRKKFDFLSSRISEIFNHNQKKLIA